MRVHDALEFRDRRRIPDEITGHREARPRYYRPFRGIDDAGPRQPGHIDPIDGKGASVIQSENDQVVWVLECGAFDTPLDSYDLALIVEVAVMRMRRRPGECDK